MEFRCDFFLNNDCEMAIGGGAIHEAEVDERALQMENNVVLFGCFRLSVAERLLEQNGSPVKLNDRALDVLIALVEHAGEIMDKKDLIAQVWPGVAVKENGLRSHVAALRKALGCGRAGTQYLATVPRRGYCFVAPISRSNISRRETTETGVRERSGKLPARLTRMAGRAASITEISKRLSAGRFVTIVGSGGIGKTTVAMSLAHLLAEEFENGVYYIDLGTLDDPRLVPAAVASMLGITVRSDDPTSILITFLRQKRMLLVFDGCEHVMAAAATLTERISREASQVYVLAASREPLRVDGEQIHRLSPRIEVADESSDLHNRLKQAEAALREAERRHLDAQMQLAHVHRIATMGQLAASIAHEINQPIAATLLNAATALRRLAAQPPKFDSVKRSIDFIINDNKRAAEIIGLIRGLVKKAPVRKQELEINQVIFEVIALTRSEMSKNLVLVQTRLANGLPSIWGDRVQLQQVILNLILNATEAMSEVSEGSRELSISTSRADSNGVMVAVRDSGPGLPDASPERVFEAFYTTKPSGLGMGLSICRSIVEAHGGRLWATPNEPHGAAFCMMLPIVEKSIENLESSGA
jgi:signal transduction histidine kinase/DNA-binding winged helix-turn-helix (wHTH) protein